MERASLQLIVDTEPGREPMFATQEIPGGERVTCNRKGLRCSYDIPGRLD